MEDETHGGTEETGGQEGGTSQVDDQQEQGTQAQEDVGNTSAPDFEAQIAERDARIAELEGQVAEAARTAEAAEQMRGELAELRAQGESDRIEFKLQLAGVRNVKAARALLADHDNDVDKLREAEPWLFAKHLPQDGATGTTGLPNAGAASDDGKTLKHWREIAGLEDEKKE